MEEKNINKEEKIGRVKQKTKMPWQGIVGSITIFLGGIVSLIASFYLATVSFNDYSVPIIVSFTKSLIITISFGGILMLGFLKSWKWSIHVVVFVSIFRIVSTLLSFVDWFFVDDYFFKSDLSSMISSSLGVILFYGFLIYLGFACLRHPFYNQNNSIKLKDIINKIKPYAKKNKGDQRSTVEWT